MCFTSVLSQSIIYINPWIFEEIRYFLDHGEKMQPRSMQWKMDILKEHVDASIAWIGDERKGIVHSRRHFANSPVMKGLPDSKQLRIALLRADTREEVFALMDEFVKRYGGGT